MGRKINAWARPWSMKINFSIKEYEKSREKGQGIVKIQFMNPVEKEKLWLWKKLFPEIQFLIIWYWKLATIEKINWKLIFYTEFVGIFLSFQFIFFEKNSFNFFPPIGRKTTACRRPHWITQSLKIQKRG